MKHHYIFMDGNLGKHSSKVSELRTDFLISHIIVRTSRKKYMQRTT